MTLEEAAERLYGADLGDFVGVRRELVAALRKSGDPEGADEVAGWRKPTLPAWVVNRVARTARRDVDLLLDAGHRLLEAQRASLDEGGRKRLDAASAAQRAALDKLTRRAESLLGGRASPATLTKVATTLRTASISAEGREALARGVLTRELSGTGWDELEALGVAPRPKRAGVTSPAGDERARRRAEEALAEAETALAAAEEDERRAEQALDDARRAATEARRRRTQAGAAVERARRALRKLDRSSG